MQYMLLIYDEEKIWDEMPEAQRNEQRSQQEEVRRLKAELKRVTEERDILKKAAAFFANESR